MDVDARGLDPNDDQGILNALQYFIDNVDPKEQPGILDVRLVARIIRRIRQLEQRVSALEAKVG